jgi:glutamyl-Q tRNA(Asp) synthetase
MSVPDLSGLAAGADGAGTMRAGADGASDDMNDRSSRRYVGRFAPSPTGSLHAGSLVAAMASFLDARAHGGRWLLRIEDLDSARCSDEAATAIMDDLRGLGMDWDDDAAWQSRRTSLYQAALERLGPLAYPCACSRREIADSRLGVASDGAAIYPGTCRHGLPPGRPARAMRLRVPDAGRPEGTICFDDRLLGRVCQDLGAEAGDFVLRRADGYWAYQLAVVVDDAEQGVTDVVRGTDLLDSTARQIWLQRSLGLPSPRYLHVPVVPAADGQKLSKQTGAARLDLSRPLAELERAAAFLGLRLDATVVTPAQFWDCATEAWRARLAV